MKKPNEVWKLLSIFAARWSQEYGGDIYPRSGHDMRAAKEFLSLYPEFFEDDVLRDTFIEWVGNYLADQFWYKPSGNPPLRHEFHHFVNHITKYSSAKKTNATRPVRRQSDPVDALIPCGVCGKPFPATKGCQTPGCSENYLTEQSSDEPFSREEVQAMIGEMLKRRV